jgi:hypothetical protein
MHSQNKINLTLNHLFKGNALAYNQNYTDSQDRQLSFSPVRYYMSSIKITHDGGQLTLLNDVYVLGEGNVSNYTIDGSFDINSIEKIEFDLGVDYNANHGNTSNFPSSHPLGPKTPTMDWGWPSGYFFLVLDGKVDDTGDGTPNKDFQIECFGDELLRTIDPITFDTLIEVDGTDLNIILYVNVDRWFNQMDYATVGFNHGALAANVNAVDNTNSQKVFTANPPPNQVSIQEQFDELAYITTDYSMTYAPVLFYKLPESNYSLSIIDMSGRRVVKERNVGFEGNYFVKSELQTGMYFAIFTAESGYQNVHQFIVQR